MLTYRFPVYRTRGADQVECVVCPTQCGKYRVMHLRHVFQHEKTRMHEKAIQNAKKPPSKPLNFSSAQPRIPDDVNLHGVCGDIQTESMPETTATGQFICEDDFSMEEGPQISFGELWEPIQRTFTLGDLGERDYFEEAVKELLEGHPQLSFVPQATEELPVEGDDFGIELPGKYSFCLVFVPTYNNSGLAKRTATYSRSRKQDAVSPSSSTYPWPSMPVCVFRHRITTIF